MNKELIKQQIARSMEISAQLQEEIVTLNNQKPSSYLEVVVVSALVGAIVALWFIVFFD